MEAVEAELAVNIGNPTSYADLETQASPAKPESLPHKVVDKVAQLVEKVTR
jgi:hypothetical protein